MKKVIQLIVIFSMIILVACSIDEDEELTKVVLAGGEWDSILFHNGIAEKIIKEGYGYDVDIIMGSTAAILQGVRQGDIDLIIEMWTDTMKEVYEEGTEAGDLVTIGKNFDSIANGFHVPTYVIEGDPERGIKPLAPDLKRVEDLKKYPDLFPDPEDPEKGIFYNGPSSWAVKEIMDDKFDAYGLDEAYNNFSAGSQAALNAVLADAYEKGKPWLGYAWAPTATTALYDLTLLEEDPYDEEIYNDTRKTMRPPQEVYIVANHIFAEKAPELVEFFSNYETSQDLTEEGVKYMLENDISPEETAEWWLVEYDDLWTKWVPEDVAEKVKQSLSN
ncbi:MAG TPA: ABC transporter substrate-binding protein [Bacillota bacterium]|nr:ABC transporter substrate-binding protein [Bacillota bacterium]